MLRQHLHRVVDLRVWCRSDTVWSPFNGTSLPALWTLKISFAPTAYYYLPDYLPELQCLRLRACSEPL